MRRLCERPGCSNDGTVSYGMEPTDLVFWLDGGVDDQSRALCGLHADAMVVPRGWTLDDRRQPEPQLFASGRFRSDEREATVRPPRPRRPKANVEQLVIDGTGEIGRPSPDPADEADADDDAASPWVAWYDPSDDLGGVLDATSPLLSRAFRGERRRS